jgi:beta-N-acetylhexosaminidase
LGKYNQTLEKGSFRIVARAKVSRKYGKLLSAGCIVLALSAFAVDPLSALAAPFSQGQDPRAKAEALLEDLSPEEKVGQLFLATFAGNQISEESQIFDLIYNYHVGGVVLRREMNNFVAAPDTANTLVSLVTDLQRAEAASSQSSRPDAQSGESYAPNYIPLFVAMSQEGDGYPNDQLLDVLSPQPNAMTLGATWQPDFARQSGELLGTELSELGINMLLGPSLDVLESPSPDSAGDLGVRSFGGDPYWVGQFGRAFIEGVHAGSHGHVALIAKHLPGHGGSDRPVEEEVPTVRKSLDQLTQIELPPFFAVTGEAPSAETTADGMLLAHIRYQGFQGNIRVTTRPISFDSQAFAQLMALPAFATWREVGGLIISDSLGTRAVRRNYDASEQVFNSPLVARDAFLAGNDILYLGNFTANTDPDQYTSIVRTLQFFAQKYREDQAFQDRVDESVLRILTLKFKLYSTFALSNVLPAGDPTESIGKQDGLIFEIGREAATLFSPSPEELTNVLPSPPGQFEQIVFITDSFSVQQCGDCPPQSILPTSTLSDAVLDLYGPNGANLTTAANLSSFSFTQLTQSLNSMLVGEQDALIANLQRAEWVVFGLMKEDSSRGDSLALQRLLSERPDLLQNKKVIVFALNAPYYLDATDITKITAYYGLYSRNPKMAEVAARLLYQELGTPGSSPVSISGIGYNLLEAISPDPSQGILISVTRILPAAENTATPPATEAQITAQPTPFLTYQRGDLLSLQAGPMLDHNRHLVPDNTPVNFWINITIEGTTLTRQVTAITQQGVAQANYSIEAEGGLDILASSGEPPASSQTLHFDVVGINPEGLAFQATQTAQALLQATPSVEAVATPIVDGNSSEETQTGFIDWFLVILISTFGSLFAYQAGANIGQIRWAIRWALTTLIGGLAVGSYLALNFPGTRTILMFSGEWGVVLVVLLGTGLGWLAGWAWRETSRQPKAKN